MSIIYLITNDINDKVYIGKTNHSIEKRFKEHCHDAFKNRNEKRPLYSAMRKYGIEHFTIKEIEKCEYFEAEEKEKYYIKLYNSYHYGYNATKGGDGKTLYNRELIAKRLKEYPIGKDVAKEFNCCVDIIYDIAKEYNILLPGKSLLKQMQTKIGIVDKNQKTLQSFDSIVDAANWCIENKYSFASLKNTKHNIIRCANQKRQKAYGYIWVYL